MASSMQHFRLLLTSAICIALTWGDTKQEYLQRRQNFTQEERMIGTGGRVHFNAKEAAVNGKLMELKNKEIDSYRSSNNGQDFPPAKHFFLAKPNIESSEVFQILKAMPKGAALHVHDQAIADIRWLISNLTYHPNCYMCNSTTGALRMGFYGSPPADPNCEWEKVNDARADYEDSESFDEMLYHKMTMDSHAEFPNQNALWEKFYSCFSAIEGLFFSEIGFDAIFTKAMQEFYDDNVQYMEVRALFMNVSRLDGSHYDTTWLVGAFADAADRFSQQNPGFAGAKVIPTVIRAMDKDVAAAGIQDALRWKRQFPDHIAGFDLVGQEDPGHTLLYFIDELLAPTEQGDVDLPYMFHAGETNWIGEDVDNNLVDALLLNATRIGHGYALAHHPAALKYVMENNVAIEVNPVCNQVLGLVSDLRNHPAAVFMAMGAPVVISSDDPVLWGASGLSYDFYEAFMAFTGGWGDLGTLKTLAMDSIRFSAMNSDERQKTMDIWQEKWDKFLDEMMAQYQLQPAVEK